MSKTAQKQKYAEYRILITPDARTGSRTPCYTAHVPLLGIATSGDTVEEAFKNIKELISFHLEALRREGEVVPTEISAEEFIATARVAVPSR